MSYHSMQFHFLVTDHNSQKNTSRLFIDKLSDGYEWRFITEYKAYDMMEIVLLKNVYDVYQRLVAMLKMLQMDSEPFNSMAIAIPGIPTVKINLALKFDVDTIMNTIGNNLAYWPSFKQKDTYDIVCDHKSVCDCRDYDEYN